MSSPELKLACTCAVSDGVPLQSIYVALVVGTLRAWAFPAALVMLPTMPHIHPRMASEYEGPTDIRRLEPPGFLGLNYGYLTPLTTLIAQTAYSLVLGAFLPA